MSESSLGLRCCSEYVDDLDAEEQDGVGGDLGAGAATVRIVWRTGQLSLAALLETDEAFIPALYHHTLANGEWQRLSPVIRSVKFGAVEKSAAVVSFDFVTYFDCRTITFLRHFDLEFDSLFGLLLWLFFFLLFGLLFLLAPFER